VADRRGLANSPQGEPGAGIEIPAARTAVLSDDDVVGRLYVRAQSSQLSRPAMCTSSPVGRDAVHAEFAEGRDEPHAEQVAARRPDAS
jgi:hypothetical protein